MTFLYTTAKKDEKRRFKASNHYPLCLHIFLSFAQMAQSCCCSDEQGGQRLLLIPEHSAAIKLTRPLLSETVIWMNKLISQSTERVFAFSAWGFFFYIKLRRPLCRAGAATDFRNVQDLHYDWVFTTQNRIKVIQLKKKTALQ